MKPIVKIGLAVLIWKMLKPKGSNASIQGIRKVRFIPVFKKLPTTTENGKTNLAFTRGKTGVYIIKEDGKIVYVGQSKNDLYRTIMRHFYNWDRSYSNGEKIDRTSYDTSKYRKEYTIRVVFTPISKAEKLEAKLILKHKPRDNYEKQMWMNFKPEALEKVEKEYKEAEVIYNPEDIPF